MIATKQIAVTDNNSRNYRQHTIIRKKYAKSIQQQKKYLD
jgi:hypothetical protein